MVFFIDLVCTYVQKLLSEKFAFVLVTDGNLQLENHFVLRLNLLLGKVAGCALYWIVI